MKINLTFRWKIFIFYSLFILLLILGLAISFYMYVGNTLTKSCFASMEQSVKRVSSQLDSVVDKMDNLSTLIFNNKSLQNILVDTLSLQSGDINYFDIKVDEKTKVKEILFSVIGIKNTPRRVCIFNGKQNYVSFSMFPTNELVAGTDLRKLQWLKDINQRNGNSILLAPDKDLWAYKNDSDIVISFVRKILYWWGNSASLGYIEIQQPYSMLDDICKPSMTGNTKILIRDEKGSQVYPYDIPGQKDYDYYFDTGSNPETQNTFIIKNPKTGASELIYKTVSPITKWTILQVLPQKDFIAPVVRIQQFIILAGILLILVTLIILFLITNSLTNPIKQLRRSLKSVSLQTPTLDIDFQNSNNEIILLNSAFNKTIQRLHESMSQTIQARSKEIEAHLLALQAQMNPHFLYNSLMGISAVGQEYNNEKVVDMCTRLSHMLRYTASYNSSIVSLSDEIKHAENYIRMVKFRYEYTFSYEFEIDTKMDNIKVPKLVLQPIIENSFSHSFANIKPPYDIIVTGAISDNSWTISVTDNGSGFSTDILENISAQIKSYDESISNNTFNDNLKVGGMAIFNIYVRLKILYNEDVIFNICNNDNKGATVTIGGRII